MARVLPFGLGGTLSAAEQRALVESWALAAGHDVVRPVSGIGAMLDACRAGRVDIVGVTELARLANCAGVLAAVLLLLAKTNVQVAVVLPESGQPAIYRPGSLELAASPELARAFGELAHEESHDWSAARERRRRPDGRWLAGWRPRR